MTKKILLKRCFLFAIFYASCLFAGAQQKVSSQIKPAQTAIIFKSCTTVSDYMKTASFEKLPANIKAGFAKLKSGTTVAQLNNALQGGSELSMIRIQSLVSQRQQAVQLTTQMLQGIKQVTDSLIKNIGH